MRLPNRLTRERELSLIYPRWRATNPRFGLMRMLTRRRLSSCAAWFRVRG